MAEVSNVPSFPQQIVLQQEQEQEQPQQQQHGGEVGPPCSYIQALGSITADCSSNNDEGDIYAFDFEPLSPSNLSLYMPSPSPLQCRFSSISDSDSDSESDHSDPLTASDCFFDEDEQMNFITDLFHSSEEHLIHHPDPFSHPFSNTLAGNDDFDIGVSEESVHDDDFGPNYADQLRVALGSRAEFGREAFASESGESLTVPDVESRIGGLRIVGIESDSDSEEVEGIFGIDYDGQDNGADAESSVFWDCLRFDNQRVVNEEFDWEEVNERVEGREGLRSLIDRIEEISVYSETSFSEADAGDNDINEEAVRDFEWEVLLAVNNLERSLEFENDGDGVSYLALQDDYMYSGEYDTLFEQFVESENAFKGSPPAAKSFVESLPSVVLTKEDLMLDNVVCAICKEEILVEEKVFRLPCCHQYHGDCIVPWLSIRNTCPVCRYELPTDDADYEQRKNERGALGLIDDLQVRYNFDLLPRTL